MFRILPLAIALIGSALICGCGGGGGGSSPGGGGGGSSTNSLTGNYSGKGTDSDNSDVLSVNIGVGSDSTLCGTMTNTTEKTKATLGGLVTDAGTISEGSVQFYDQKGNAVGAVDGMTGSITSMPGSQTLAVALTVTEGAHRVKYTFASVQNVSAQVAKVANARKAKRAARRALAAQQKAGG